MPKTKAQKQEILKNLAEQIEKQKSVVFVDFKGLKVKDLLALRRQLKQTDAKLQVVKKTLLQRVFNEKKIGVDLKKLIGEVAAIFTTEDPLPAVKLAYQFARTNEHLKILGGYFDNQMYEAEILREIANLPTKEELLARLVGSIASPISGFMNILQGNIKGLIAALNAVANKQPITNNQ